jgi:predicted metal-binding protein
MNHEELMSEFKTTLSNARTEDELNIIVRKVPGQSSMSNACEVRRKEIRVSEAKRITAKCNTTGEVRPLMAASNSRHDFKEVIEIYQSRYDELLIKEAEEKVQQYTRIEEAYADHQKNVDTAAAEVHEAAWLKFYLKA